MARFEVPIAVAHAQGGNLQLVADKLSALRTKILLQTSRVDLSDAHDRLLPRVFPRARDCTVYHLHQTRDHYVAIIAHYTRGLTAHPIQYR